MPNEFMPTKFQRYALVRGSATRLMIDVVERYMPTNYRVLGEVECQEPWGTTYRALVIAGRDDHGWTLDGYVIPRLSSGLYGAVEIDLSHPAMKQIPV